MLFSRNGLLGLSIISTAFLSMNSMDYWLFCTYCIQDLFFSCPFKRARCSKSARYDRKVSR